MRQELVKLVGLNLTQSMLPPIQPQLPLPATMPPVKLEVHFPPPSPAPAQPQIHLPTPTQPQAQSPAVAQPQVQLPTAVPPVQQVRSPMSATVPAPVQPQVQIPAPPQPPPAPMATSLAPGFRFHPTDEELVTYYLRRKLCGKTFRFQAVSEIDVYKSEPWQLSEFSCLRTRDLEWYFFSPVDKKYGNGSRLNRATGQGYWKATGKDRHVRHQNQVIGMKKTLVFHTGRAPDGARTNWVMHEYRLADEGLEQVGVPQEKQAFVICRIFQKSGLGPPNGNRYAPFVEEEWDDDDNATLLVPRAEAVQEMVTGDEMSDGCNNFEQETNHMTKAHVLPEKNIESHNFPIICKRERVEEEPEPLSLSQNKKSKHGDPSSRNVNGCEHSTTTSQDFQRMMMTTNSFSSNLLEFPLVERSEPKESQPANPPTFDSSNLEKYVPPGYLKFISDLESGILNVSRERETLKLEVMRFQAKINMLQSRIDFLSKENEDLRNLN